MDNGNVDSLSRLMTVTDDDDPVIQFKTFADLTDPGVNPDIRKTTCSTQTPNWMDAKKRMWSDEINNLENKTPGSQVQNKEDNVITLQN